MTNNNAIQNLNTLLGESKARERDLAKRLEAAEGELAIYKIAELAASDVAQPYLGAKIENAIRQEVRRRTNRVRKDLGRAGETIHVLRAELALEREKSRARSNEDLLAGLLEAIGGQLNVEEIA